MAAERRSRAPRGGRRRGARAHVRHVDAPRHPRLAHAAGHPPEPRGHARPLRRVVQRGVAAPLGRRPRRHAAARGGRAPPRRRTARSSSRRRRALVEDKDRVVRKSDGDLGVLRLGHRILCRQDLSRLRPPHRRPRRRPPRLRRASPQRPCRARPPAGALRGAAIPARLHHQGRRGGQEQQARRELRHRRRGHRRDRRGGGPQGRRRGRAALLLPVAQRELERRVRHRAREEKVARQPGLLRPVRLRAALLDPA